MDTLQIERILKNDSAQKRFLKVFILKISYLLWSILSVMLLTPIQALLLENTGLLCSSTIKDLLSFLIAMAYTQLFMV